MNNRLLISTIMIIFLAVCASTAQAAKNIEVDFEYTGQAESFNLYMDGSVICTDVATGKMTCNDIAIDYGMHQFTMTAISGGLETLHSPAYMWSYSPVQGAGPTIINFNVTVEGGKVVPLGAVKIN